jgi:hypothetical protein
LDAHRIPDYAAWRDERLDLMFDEIHYTPSIVLKEEEVARVGFHVTNRSAYGWRNLGLLILLERRGETVGIAKTVVGELPSLASLPVSFVLFDPLEAVDQVRIVPVVDLFDSGSYLPISRDGRPQTDGR